VAPQFTSPLKPTAARLLSDSEHHQFQADGFVDIRGLSPHDDLMVVREIVDGLFQRAGREAGALPNVLRHAPQLRETAVFRSSLAIAKQVLGRTARYVCDNALYKEPHGDHGTPWHQDGAFHGRYFPNNTLAFWIPLQDVTPENGCMQYIPLSQYPFLLPHRPYYPNDRGSMMTDHADRTLAVVCPLRAGDAVIHGPLTLHAAPANQTASVRRTWLITFRPLGRWGALDPSRLVQRARLLRKRLLSRRDLEQRLDQNKGHFEQGGDEICSPLNSSCSAHSS
jgi:hypothetical protein